MYEEVTISLAHPNCAGEGLRCTNRRDNGTLAPQPTGVVQEKPSGVAAHKKEEIPEGISSLCGR